MKNKRGLIFSSLFSVCALAGILFLTNSNEIKTRAESFQKRALRFYSAEHYEHFKGSNENIEYIFIGDSFLSESKNSFKETIPYLFWELNQKEFTVRNMGRHETSSQFAYLQIKDFIKSREFSPSKKYTFIVLAGSNDIYTQHPFFEETSRYQDFIEAPKRWLPEKLGFIDQLFALLETNFLTNFYYSFFSDINSAQEKFPKAKHCFETHQAEFSSCLSSLQYSNGELYFLYKNLSTQYFLHPQKHLEMILALLSTYPHIVGKFHELTNDLAIQLSRVSSLERKETIQKITTRFKTQPLPDLMRKAFENIQSWDDELHELAKCQEKNLLKIIKLIQNTPNSNVVLMTYPFSLPSPNATLRKIAQDGHIALVDLENDFFNGRDIQEIILQPYQFNLLGNKEVATQLVNFLHHEFLSHTGDE